MAPPSAPTDNSEHRVAVDISVSCQSWQSELPAVRDICRKAIREAIHTAARLSPTVQAEVSLVLSDDDFMQGLNRQYRKIDRPTNVLAFPGDDLGDTLDDLPEGISVAAPVLLGDVIVAFETAVSEARADNKSLADHLSHLVVHGTLHLMGFDHENDADAQEMESLETKVLAALGVGNPYNEGS